MKILYDHPIFELQAYGGISRYFYELMNSFRKNNLVDFELSLLYSNNSYLKCDDYFGIKIKNLRPYREFLSGISFKGKGKIYKVFKELRLINSDFTGNEKFSKRKLKEGNYDVFHPTYYDDYFLDYINNKPFVLTIFDMTMEIFPEFFPKDKHIIEMKKKLSKIAKKIITISINTKKDVIKFFNTPEEKIEVIYLANSLDSSVNLNNYDLSFLNHNIHRYILFVGNRQHYKNFNLFIKAISNVLIKDRDLNVVCAGGGSFTTKELEEFDRLGIRSQLFQTGINDNLLYNLYQNALAFVFPSLYEGFGIPILEAFSCGCPVVLSNSSSFPEIALDAAVYFNPKNQDSIYKAIEKVVYNFKLREKLRKKGFERAKDFSWEKTIKETAEVYKSII